MVRRELRVTAAPGCMRHFEGMDRLWVAAPGFGPAGLKRTVLPCRVDRVRPADDSSWIVTLSPGVPRDWVSLMKGGEARLPKSLLKPPEPDDFVAEDLAGMVVVENDEILGVIIRAYDNGVYAVAEIELRDGACGALALAGPVLEGMDFAGGVVRVRDAVARMVLDRTPRS